jgi:predicted transcriptional regulator
VFFYHADIIERKTVKANSLGPDPQAKRRDKLYIIAEILDIARDGVLKTQIMYRANLSFTQLNNYLRLMEKASLIDKKVEGGKEFYKATPKGLEFLQRYREIIELLKTENSGNDIKIRLNCLLKKNRL